MLSSSFSNASAQWLAPDHTHVTILTPVCRIPRSGPQKSPTYLALPSQLSLLVQSQRDASHTFTQSMDCKGLL